MSLLVMLKVIRKHRVFIKINNFPDFTCYEHSKFVMHSSLMQAHGDDKLYNKLKEYKKLHLLNNLHKSDTQVSVKVKGSLRTEYYNLQPKHFGKSVTCFAIAALNKVKLIENKWTASISHGHMLG